MKKQAISGIFGIIFAVTIFAGPNKTISQEISEPALKVVVSTPDVLSIARKLGAELIQATSITNGPDDPHIVNLRPSHILEMRQADLFIQVGQGIEDAWIEDLLSQAQNSSVVAGADGHLDLSKGIRPLDAITSDPIEKNQDSFHEEGNPHYLLDPVEGLKAARMISEKFKQLLPDEVNRLQRLYSDFAGNWAELYFGASIIAKTGKSDLEKFGDNDALEKYISEIISDHNFGPEDGLVGKMAPFVDTPFIGDHDLWPYFARRFNLRVIDYLEPAPGVPPNTKHLANIIRKIRENEIEVILTAPYFDQRHVRFISEKTDTRIVPLAHQTGGRENTADYLDMLRYNIDQLTAALRNQRSNPK